MSRNCNLFLFILRFPSNKKKVWWGGRAIIVTYFFPSCYSDIKKCVADTKTDIQNVIVVSNEIFYPIPSLPEKNVLDRKKNTKKIASVSFFSLHGGQEIQCLPYEGFFYLQLVSLIEEIPASLICIIGTPFMKTKICMWTSCISWCNFCWSW